MGTTYGILLLAAAIFIAVKSRHSSVRAAYRQVVMVFMGVMAVVVLIAGPGAFKLLGVLILFALAYAVIKAEETVEGRKFDD